MDATVADDKLHAVVNLVLSAVDQRLGPVREQLAELTNAMHRSHTELSGRIDECQRLVAALQASGLQPTGVQTAEHREYDAGAGDGWARASEPMRSPDGNHNVAPAVARLAPLSRADHVSAPQSFFTEPESLAESPSTVSETHSLSTMQPSVQRNAQPGNQFVASPVNATPAPPQPVVTPCPEPMIQMSDDIARLSAQMSARLGAAVDRALGIVPGT